MGLVFFSTGSRIQLPVISDQTAYRQAIYDFTRLNHGYTWIGAGIVNGANLLMNAPRKNVPKILLLLTDGVENAPDPFYFNNQDWGNTPYNNLDWLTYLQAVPATLVCIGVHNPIANTQINPVYLTTIASANTTGQKMYFETSDFTALQSSQLISQITRQLCFASGVPSNPCPSCNGLCTCGTCNCPSTCDNGNPCVVGTCSATKNNQGGCLYTNVSCDDQDYCTNDLCDPTRPGGCYHTNVTCTNPNVCTINTCQSSVGCIATPVDQNYCYDPTRPCWVRNCDNTTGACVDVTNLCANKNPCTFNNGTPNVFYPIDCQAGNFCRSAACDTKSTNSNGCLNTAIKCDDGSACTSKSCDAKTGCIFTPINCNDSNPCTIDSCDQKLGCVYKLIDVASVCNDGSACTIDTCDNSTGCVNTPLICNATTTNSTYNYANVSSNYTNVCSVVYNCDSIQGCTQAQKCNVTLDVTPICTFSNCDTTETNCSTSKNTLNPACAAIVATGAILGTAAIIAIIAGVVVCAAGTTVGTIYGLTKGFSGVFENKNSIYEPETVQGNNPAFGRDSVFNTKPVKPQ